MKWNRSFLLTLVYGLFTLLYTVYVAAHPGYFHWKKGLHWGYYLKFLLVGNYLFFILQGILLKSKNWGVVLLLPLILMALAILTGYVFVGFLRLGGGTLLDGDRADMILGGLLMLVGSWFSLRFIDHKNHRHAK